MNAIVGHTGFVGSNLIEGFRFHHMFNTVNINDITNHEYDLVVCAGIPSLKWAANKNPKDDLDNIIELTNILKNVKTNYFILISTIDVFEKISNNPDLVKCSEFHHPYGFNRYYAEEKLRQTFGDNLMIIRLPAVFGDNLKKNILFDLLNNKIHNKINLCDKYQWYDVRELSRDITFLFGGGISEINLFSEPISMKEIIDDFFIVSPENLYSDCDSATTYDLISRVEYPKYWDSKYAIMDKMKKFIKDYGKS